MSTVIDFKTALLRKRDKEFGLRTIIPNDFVKKALAAGRDHSEKVDNAILKAECLMNEWRRKKAGDVTCS